MNNNLNNKENFNITNNQNNTEYTNSETTYKPVKQISDKSIILLAIAIVNIGTFFPFVMQFALTWLIFGAFGDKTTYYGMLIPCIIYIIISLIFLVKSIWNIVKNIIKK